MASSVSSLREELIALSGVDIMEADNMTFKSTYQIFDELSRVWDTLSDIDRANITEKIAGKRQGNLMSALMSNFETARKVLKTSMNSAGSAADEFGKQMDSIDAKTAQLKATWESFSTNFLDSSFIKGVVDALRSLLSVLDAITNKLGGGATTGLVAALGIGGFATASKIKSSGGIIEVAKNLPSLFTKAKTALTQYGTATKVVSTATAELGAQTATVTEYMAHAPAEFQAVVASSSQAATSATTLGSSFAAAVPQVLLLVGAIASVVAIGYEVNKALNKKYDFGKGLSESAAKLNESTQDIHELVSLLDETKELELTIKSKDKSESEINSAKSRIEEIAKILSDEYNLNIKADTGDIERALSTLTQIERKEAFQDSKDTLNDIQNTANEYAEAVKNYSNIEAQNKAVQDLSLSYDDLYNRAKLYQELYSKDQNDKQFIQDMSSVTDQAKSLYQQAKDLGLNTQNMDSYFENIKDGVTTLNDARSVMGMLQEGAIATARATSDLSDKFNRTSDSIRQFKEATDSYSRSMSEILASDVKSGLDTTTDEAYFKDFGKTIAETGTSTLNLAQQFALAKQGYTSFSEELLKSEDGMNQLYDTFMAFEASIGASTSDIVKGGALIKSGIGDASRITDENLKSLYDTMVKIGNEQFSTPEESINNAIQGTALLKAGYQDIYDALIDGNNGVAAVTGNMYQIMKENVEGFSSLSLEEQTSQINQMARAMELIPEDKAINITAEGDIEVIDSVSQKLKDELTDQDITIEAKAELLAEVVNDGDITAEGVAELIGEIIQSGELTAEGIAELKPVLEKLGYEITEEGTVIYRNDTTDPDNYTAPDKDATVTYNKESSSVDGYDPPNLWRTVTYTIKKIWENITGGGEEQEYTGTASTRGVSLLHGTAYASGNWGIQYDQTALVGEAGAEIRVNSRTGKWELLGANSAQFAHLNKGDIIFNAQQTRDLIKHGKIINGSRRGKTYGDSYASGSALLSGNAYVSATAPDGTTRMDYIERLFERIENSIDIIRTKAESAYKSLETRTKSSYSLISELKSAANTYKQGADTYLNYANSIEGNQIALDQGKYGAMGMWDAADFNANETKAVAEYMGKYEDALQKYYDTLEDIAEAYQDMFDMIEENYENELKMVEALSDSYDNLLDKIETSGYLVDSKVYANLIAAKTDEITVLRKELSELEASFKEAMDSGYIEEYSEAWYEMKESINDTSNAIEECEVDLIKLRKEMRDAEWDYFDYIDDRISALQTESEFMIDLMEKYDLYDKNGNITEYGQATLGLHGQNYNALMNQADSYAKEIKSLNKQIAQDPNNTELIDRRQDLLELQQKAILAAEDEKQAIRDLVEEGINTELDALDELIDKYTETIDTAKDLYDYQKNVKEQTEEIAKLQKQLSAYSSDTSQEARAKIQTIKVDLAKAQEELAETQYDQYISDQKKLLENLRDEYELLLNERLDDVDALISDVIDSVNSSSVDICNTLNDVSDEVGYTMTDSMQKVWDGSTLAINGVITKYGDNFDTKLTAVNATLSAIRTSVDKVAGVNQTTSTSGSTSSSSSSSSSSSVSARTTTAAVSTTPAAKTITVGGLINAGSAPIYQWAGGEGYSQYFSSDPIYTVLQESNGFVQVRWHNLSSGITGWFRKSDVTAYKKGGLVDYTGLAWLDGSPSNPEYILNAKDTKALMGSGTAPRYSISGGLSIADLIAKLDSSAGNIGNSIGDIIMNVAVDHVEDYEDFVTKLQQDDQFEKLIRSMTIDRLAGKSSLAKNKFKW